MLKVFFKYKDTGSEFTITFKSYKEFDSYLAFNESSLAYWKVIEG